MTTDTVATFVDPEIGPVTIQPITPHTWSEVRREVERALDSGVEIVVDVGDEDVRGLGDTGAARVVLTQHWVVRAAVLEPEPPALHAPPLTADVPLIDTGGDGWSPAAVTRVANAILDRAGGED